MEQNFKGENICEFWQLINIFPIKIFHSPAIFYIAEFTQALSFRRFVNVFSCLFVNAEAITYFKISSVVQANN